MANFLCVFGRNLKLIATGLGWWGNYEIFLLTPEVYAQPWLAGQKDFQNFYFLQLCNIAGLLDRPVVRTSWMDQMDRSAGRTSWMDQLDGRAGQTSSFYLKPWPFRIFEDYPFSLYIVAASESDEGLVCLKTLD